MGDTLAFRDLYDSTSAKLLGVCVRMLGERSEAEDALQEVYLAIWRRAATFDAARGSAATWMTTIARNCAIDRLRARPRGAVAPLELADEVPDEAPLASDLAERAQGRARLETCLGLLAAGDVMLIRTAFYEGATYRELAGRTDRPLATIKSRVRRALVKLAECLR